LLVLETWRTAKGSQKFNAPGRLLVGDARAAGAAAASSAPGSETFCLWRRIETAMRTMTFLKALLALSVVAAAALGACASDNGGGSSDGSAGGPATTSTSSGSTDGGAPPATTGGGGW
jgi:hypothetical protein